MPPNQVNGITALTPCTVCMRWRSLIGRRNASDTECRDSNREGLLSSLPRSNSVRIVARLMIRNSETTRLETVSRVRRLLRRTFFNMSLANLINAPQLDKGGNLYFETIRRRSDTGSLPVVSRTARPEIDMLEQKNPENMD